MDRWGAVGQHDRCLGPELVEVRDLHLERVLRPARLPDQGSGVAVELAFLDVEELAGTHPVALVVGHEDPILVVDHDAAG